MAPGVSYSALFFRIVCCVFFGATRDAYGGRLRRGLLTSYSVLLSATRALGGDLKACTIGVRRLSLAEVSSLFGFECVRPYDCLSPFCP